jgi:diguanylate cyclase (GGDEF)-like protein
VIAIDLNGLKEANDGLGHSAGDAMLRRAGEVLAKLVERPACAARIGGDEFAILLPGTDEREGAIMIESIAGLIDVNNQFYSGPELSMAMGAATSEPHERLEETFKRADLRMYDAKRAHYRTSSQERRGR